MRMQAQGRKVALFLVMDTIPIHIQQTFGLTEDGLLKHDMTGMMVVKMGETIPDRLDSAIIMFNVSGWHTQRADELAQQLEQLDSRITICSFPVIQDAAPNNAVGILQSSAGAITTQPSSSSPPIYWPNPLVPFETTRPSGWFDLDDWHQFGKETTKGTAVPAKVVFNSDKHNGVYSVEWHEPGDGTVEETPADWDWDDQGNVKGNWRRNKVAKEIAKVFDISLQELGISPD